MVSLNDVSLKLSSAKQAKTEAPKKQQPSLSIKEIREWMECAKQNNVESIRALYGAQPLLLDAAQSGIGNTALHWAAAKSSQQVLQYLLEKKASPTLMNSSGSTPLHSAVRQSWRGGRKVRRRVNRRESVVRRDG